MTTRSDRPDPDKLLARIQSEEEAGVGGRRGRLKIFFGASPGVGKTYAMLEEAQAKQAEGIDVLVGWVETHGRVETEALLAGLPILPARSTDYQGHTLREFDLDAALARRPALLLLDELAHTNAPGARHDKRWQDAEELLDAGIDVTTTLNVQHIESLNDIIAQTTGVAVRETVPDRVFEDASEIKLVDITPDDLLQRLREGKVYLGEAAGRALENFFSKGNLIALRELALRRAVERVDEQMRSYKSREGIAAVWPLRERILVCVSASPASPRVVRAARRMAAGLSAEWIVAHVEKPGTLREAEADRKRLAQTLHLAESLGAEVVTLFGHDVSEEVLAYARSRNVTKIVIGKPRGRWWRYRLLGSVVDDLVRHSDEIDVYVIRGSDEEEDRPEGGLPLRPTSPRRAYLLSLPVVAATTGVAALCDLWFSPTNLAMIYLLGVVFVAVRFGRGPSMVASVLSVLAFDFCFVPPRLTFAVADTEYVLTFLVMLAVGLVISTLGGRLRAQARSSRERERRIASLYAVSREFSRMDTIDAVVPLAERTIGETVGAEVWFLVPSPTGDLEPAPGITSAFPLRAEEKAVARWVFEHGTIAGQGTATLPGSQALWVPLTASHGTVGAMGLFLGEGVPLDPDRMRLVEALAGQTALVFERCTLAREAQRAQIQEESERLRDALLSSVSHDLRTPLGTITGAASSLADPAAQLPEEARRDLAQSIFEEAHRMNRLVNNLLSMTRLEAGAVPLQKEWQAIDEVIGGALTRLDRLLRDRPLTIRVASDLPLVPLDDVLIEQVLVNLVENAVQHTPPDTPIEIGAVVEEGGQMIVEVADRGPGLPPGWEDRVFAKFASPWDQDRSHRGGRVGLGLAICKGFVEAHGGWILAENRPGGGASFRFALPLGAGSPEPPAQEEESP